MAITTLPPRPVPGSETFEADAGALLDALPLFGDELDALQADVVARTAPIDDAAEQVQASATSTAASQAAALASANAAALSAGAALWVSGTTYALNARAISPANRYVYRRTVAGAGTTDPSADPTNWRADALEVQTWRPSIRPALMLPLRRSRALDARVVMVRDTTRQSVGQLGVLETALAGVWPLEHDTATLLPLGRSVWEQRTNLLLHSIDLSTGWTKGTLATWIPGQPAPDGSMTALGVTGLTASTLSFTGGAVYRTGVAISPSTVYTASVYVRARVGNTGTVLLRLSESVNFLSPATAIFTDRWTRLTLTVTSSASASAASFLIGTPGSTIFSDCDIWGAQLEVGPFATPYIPTTTAQVTRAADVPSISLAGLIRQGEGSLYTEFRRPFAVTAGATPRVLTLHDGSANNRISLQLSRSGSASQLAVVMVAAGVETVSSTPVTIAINDLVRVALAWRANDVALVINGALVWSTTTATIPTGLATAALGTDSAGANPLNGELGACSLYPVRLTTTELQALAAT